MQIALPSNSFLARLSGWDRALYSHDLWEYSALGWASWESCTPVSISVQLPVCLNFAMSRLLFGSLIYKAFLWHQRTRGPPALCPLKRRIGDFWKSLDSLVKKAQTHSAPFLNVPNIISQTYSKNPSIFKISTIAPKWAALCNGWEDLLYKFIIKNFTGHHAYMSSLPDFSGLYRIWNSAPYRLQYSLQPPRFEETLSKKCFFFSS